MSSAVVAQSAGGHQRMDSELLGQCHTLGIEHYDTIDLADYARFHGIFSGT